MQGYWRDVDRMVSAGYQLHLNVRICWLPARPQPKRLASRKQLPAPRPLSSVNVHIDTHIRESSLEVMLVQISSLIIADYCFLLPGGLIPKVPDSRKD